MVLGGWTRRSWIAAAFAVGALAPAFAAGDRSILVLGDSLSAEYGLKRGSGWVALLAYFALLGRARATR